MASTSGLRAPVYRLVVDGRDITPTANARLISLSLVEARGEEADQLDLVLSDHDGALEIPRKGVKISVALGWAGEALVDKGTFEVDEAEHAGAPDQIAIRARSVDMRNALRTRRDQSWHGSTLGQILTAIAGRHGLQVHVDAALAGRTIAHIDQTNESDLNFLTRLGTRHDAVATVKKGVLLLLPITGTRTRSGQALPTITLTRADGDSHRYLQSDRDAYTGVRAYWHDGRTAHRKSVLVGTAANPKVLKETFANEPDARTTAQAEWQRVQRGLATMSLTLAEGNPLLSPQVGVAVRGFKPQIDSTAWQTVRAENRLDDSGWTTQVELETTSANENKNAY